MTRYIIKCPCCGHPNAENAKLCAMDGEMLVGIDTERATEPEHGAAGPANVSRGDDATAESGLHPVQPRNGRTTLAGAPQREPQLTLYVEVRDSGRRYLVRNGDIVGRAHESSRAQVQLKAEPGIEYVHREHCRFNWHRGHWRISPINQANRARGFRNATVVAGRELGFGESRIVESGDRLLLAGVAFVIQIIWGESIGATRGDYFSNRRVNQIKPLRQADKRAPKLPDHPPVFSRWQAGSRVSPTWRAGPVGLHRASTNVELATPAAVVVQPAPVATPRSAPMPATESGELTSDR